MRIWTWLLAPLLALGVAACEGPYEDERYDEGVEETPYGIDNEGIFEEEGLEE